MHRDVMFWDEICIYIFGYYYGIFLVLVKETFIFWENVKFFSDEIYFGLTSLTCQLRGQYQTKVTESENSENRIEKTHSCAATKK